MTKKDYKLIAKAIARAETVDGEDSPSILIQAIADALAMDNPRFDIIKFLAACYGGKL